MSSSVVCVSVCVCVPCQVSCVRNFTAGVPSQIFDICFRILAACLCTPTSTSVDECANKRIHSRTHSVRTWNACTPITLTRRAARRGAGDIVDILDKQSDGCGWRVRCGGSGGGRSAHVLSAAAAANANIFAYLLCAPFHLRTNIGSRTFIQS